MSSRFRRVAHSFSCMALIALILTVSSAQAQTTVLSGKVHSNAMPQLVRQEPQYDRMPVQTPVTIVNTQRSPYQSGVTQTKTVVIQRPVYREVYVRDNRTYFQRHPKVKAVTIGAGVGAGAGALTGLVSGAGVVRGAAIGAGSGAGVGLVRSSRTMKRHPIIRDTATGTIAGLGIGAASSRRGKRAWQGAGVGAAVGLGVGLFKNLK
ncbi:glycine zipper family protein [bacterium]|jgi:hypothetical protein|nr:glycine zipper family protein [bacterium]